MVKSVYVLFNFAFIPQLSFRCLCCRLGANKPGNCKQFEVLLSLWCFSFHGSRGTRDSIFSRQHFRCSCLYGVSVFMEAAERVIPSFFATLRVFETLPDG